MQNIKKELISEQRIISVLKTRIFELSNLLAIKEKALKAAPEGNLRISKSNGAVQYYHKSTSEKSKRCSDESGLVYRSFSRKGETAL